jgi:hypothetical protein
MLNPPTSILLATPETPVAEAVRSVWFQRLATDIVLFGHDQRNELAAAYGLTSAQLETLMEDEELSNRIQTAATAASTVRGQAQLAAQSAVFMNIRNLHQLANDPKAFDKDRIAAIKELKDIAVSGDRLEAAKATSSSASGPNLVLNIGVPGASTAMTFDMKQPVPQELSDD